jgi:hypothetical protein
MYSPMQQHNPKRKSVPKNHPIDIGKPPMSNRPTLNINPSSPSFQSRNLSNDNSGIPIVSPQNIVL